ncbi:hypothetical protein CEXT_618161, partial [Caerostris extrusa]
TERTEPQISNRWSRKCTRNQQAAAESKIGAVAYCGIAANKEQPLTRYGSQALNGLNKYF